MKKFVIVPILLLLVMLIFCSANIWFIEKLANEMVDALSESHDSAVGGDWERATELASGAKDLWDSKKHYLSIVLRNSEVSDVTLSLDTMLCYTHTQSIAEFEAQSAEAKASIQRIQDMESPNIWNIF